MNTSSHPGDRRESPPRVGAGMPEGRDDLAPPRHRLRKLVSECCDSGLAPIHADEIERLLAETPELAADYASFLANESLVEQACGMTVFDAEGRGTGDAPRGSLVADAAGSTGDTSARIAWWARLARHPSWAVAAVVLLTVTAGLALWARQPLATVIAANDARLTNGREVHLGDDLGTAWLELGHGGVHVALRDGSMVAIQAPARFRVADGNAAELDHGAISVRVPKAAHGFVVTNQAAKIIDLGTGYRAVAPVDGALSIHVTRGSVRVDPLRGEGAILDAGGTASVLGDGSLQTARLSQRQLRVSGQFRFTEEHPESLGYGAFVHNGVAHAFLESHAVRLQDDLRIDLAEAGGHTDFLRGRKVIPAGTIVDCYLIHCAPRLERHEVKGSIRFSSEILGVLCNDDRLNATNEVLGTGWTLACQHSERGIESKPDPNSDTIIIDADRRRLSAHFRTMSIDQVRVLVASEIQ